MVFYKKHTQSQADYAGFTLVEAVVAITLLGIGITSAVTALTRFNTFASKSRNSTGAYAAVMNQVDAIESAAPFNPQHREDDGTLTPQTPPELTLDADRSPAGPLTETVSVYIYKDPLDLSTVIVVNGTRTTSVVDASTVYNGVTLYMRRATVTVNYTYLSRPYSLSMSTLRTSDQ